MNYKAAVVTQKGKVEVASFEMPKMDERDAIIRLSLAGVCGTDVHLAFNDEPYPGQKQQYPFRLGHEWVGKIEKMGSGFCKEDAFGNELKEGDRIVSYSASWACGECYNCKILLQPQICMHPPFRRSLPEMQSAFSEYLYLPEGSTMYKVPDNVPDKVAVLVEPMAVALRAFERSFMPGIPDRHQGMGPGKSVVVFGSGTIGTLLVILAKISGAYPITVIGGPKERLEICKKFGVDYTIDFAEMDRDARISFAKQQTIRGLGYDVAFEAAGAPSAFVDCLEVIRAGGTLVEAGHFTDHGTVPLNPLLVCQKDAHIFGSWGYGPQAFGSALRVLVSQIDRVPFADLVTHEFALDDIQNAVNTAKKQDCTKAVVNFSR